MDRDPFTIPDDFELTYDYTSFLTSNEYAILALQRYFEKSEDWLQLGQSFDFHRLSKEHKDLFEKYGHSEFSQQDYFNDQLNLTVMHQVVLRCARYSFVVLLFGTLETQLRALCKALKEKRNLPIGLSDLNKQMPKASTLEKIKVYLTEHAGLKLPSNWERMRDLSDIRNCIAHAGGRVEEIKGERKQRKLRNLKVPGYSIYQDDWTGDEVIELNEDFCKGALDEVKKILIELCAVADLPLIRSGAI